MEIKYLKPNQLFSFKCPDHLISDYYGIDSESSSFFLGGHHADGQAHIYDEENGFLVDGDAEVLLRAVSLQPGDRFTLFDEAAWGLPEDVYDKVFIAQGKIVGAGVRDQFWDWTTVIELEDEPDRFFRISDQAEVELCIST